MTDRALIVTLMLSLGGHAGAFIAGHHWGPAEPPKRQIEVTVLQKAAPPPPPKPLKREPVKPTKRTTKRTTTRGSHAKPAPPKVFGVAKSNTVGDLAVPEGNSLMTDPTATPSIALQQEEQRFWPTGEVDTAPVPKTRIQAVYPEFAKLGHIEGKVILELDVDADGNIVETRVLTSAHPSLSEAAMSAVRTARFVPAVKDGAPVAVTMRYPFRFSLSAPPTGGTEP